MFRKECNNVCNNPWGNVNGRTKQLGCNFNFLGLEFDTLLIEACLPKDKLKKAVEKVAKILEKKISTTYEKLESLLIFFLFEAYYVCLGPSISLTPRWQMLKTENICNDWRLLEMTYCKGKKIFFDGIELYPYVLITDVLNRLLDGPNARMGLAHVLAKKFSERERVPFTRQNV